MPKNHTQRTTNLSKVPMINFVAFSLSAWTHFLYGRWFANPFSLSFSICGAYLFYAHSLHHGSNANHRSQKVSKTILWPQFQSKSESCGRYSLASEKINYLFWLLETLYISSRTLNWYVWKSLESKIIWFELSGFFFLKNIFFKLYTDIVCALKKKYPRF